MKLLLAFALLAAVSCSPANVFTQFNPAGGKQFDDYWEEFKVKYEKKYETAEEEEMRKEILSANVKLVEMHNYLHSKGKKSYYLGVNEYSDMEREEFARVMNGNKQGNSTLPSRDRATFLPPLTMPDLPKTVDWRPKGYVTPIKNQGQCGSCWAFSTTGALEGQHFRKYGKLVSLSEQNLVDCSGKWGNEGCNGGLPDAAFQYIKDNKGIDTEISYPYEGQDDTCHFVKRNVGADDVGFVDITPHGSEKALEVAVATIGPISIAIDASHASFQSYSGGLYYEPECSPTSLDHAVLIVGYGTDPTYGPYWMVKNSWGTSWGMDGYIKMAKFKNNNCGVATQAAYPLV